MLEKSLADLVFWTVAKNKKQTMKISCLIDRKNKKNSHYLDFAASPCCPIQNFVGQNSMLIFFYQALIDNVER